MEKNLSDSTREMWGGGSDNDLKELQGGGFIKMDG